MAGTREATVASVSVNPLCSTSLRSVIRRRISACPMIATNDNAKYGPIAPYADRPVIHGKYDVRHYPRDARHDHPRGDKLQLRARPAASDAPFEQKGRD